MLKIEYIRNALETVVEELSAAPGAYVKRPGQDFTRNRKLGLARLSRLILAMEGNSISCELEKFFDNDKDTPTASAFVQQRGKVSPEFFHEMLLRFNDRCDDRQNYKGYRLYTVDGTYLNVAHNECADSFVAQPGTEGHNLLHINALYDISNNTYRDCVIQPCTKANERTGLISMLRSNRFREKSIVILDRGYQSYNVFAHFEHTPKVDFVCRVNQGLDTFRDIRNLPMEELDTYIHPEITTRQTKEDKRLGRILLQVPSKKRKPNPKAKYHQWDFSSPYQMHLRVVRFRIADHPGKTGDPATNPENYETIVTSLDPKEFPLSEIKKLYGLRWNVETSFRALKYAVGMVNLHAKNEDYVRQEIYAHLIMYNFSCRIAVCAQMEEKDGKYEYQVNLTMAVHFCRAFFLAQMDAAQTMAKIERYILPIRPGRQDKRKMKTKTFISFLYRVAA